MLEWCYNDVVSTLPTGAANICSSHLGSATTGTWIDSSDETGRKWQHTSDALGRLTEVMEPDGSSTVGKTASVETDYAYDALSNLLEVDQWGGSKNNGTYTDHKRTFTYNSLSQLLTSTNPESGTISYAYDANGNVSTKTEPAQNVASGTVTVSYAYDNLNRLTENPIRMASHPLHTLATTWRAFTWDQQ
jgi:YD repeat-containing protein